MIDTRKIGAAPTALLRALGDGPLTEAEVRARLGINWRQAQGAAARLMARGYLTVAPGRTYMLTDAGQAAAASGEAITGGPKGRVKLIRDTFRERAWRAMRVRRSFTIGDIVADAAGPDEGRPRDNAARYISRLRQAGYVAELPRRQAGTAPSSNGYKRFTLRKNTGPLAPVWRADLGVIFDPNIAGDAPCARP